MLELVVAVAALLVLVALAAVPPLWALIAGLAIMLPSFLFGTTAGIVYHRRLFAAYGGRPARWWLDPTVYHDTLPASDRDRVLRTFRLGVAGFVLCMAGVALVVTAWVKSL